MAIRTPPSWLQAGSHPAENDRLGTEAIIGQQGVRQSGDLLCTASGFNVVVAAGWVYVDGTISATQGMYQTYNDGAVTLPISTAHPTLARIDRVVVTVNDSFYGSPSDSAVLTLLTGTPAASPVAPTIPANSVSLATVAIAAGAVSITNANITDTRPRAAGLDWLFQQPNQTSMALTARPATPTTATITNAVYSGTTITYTAANTFVAGDVVRISGIVYTAGANFQNSLNWTRATIATASATQFTVTAGASASIGAYASGGVATKIQANLQEWQNSSGTALSSVNQFGNDSGAGLVLIDTITVASATNYYLAFNGVFSSAYDSYRIIVTGLFSNNGASVKLNLTNLGVPRVSNYNYAGIRQSTATGVITNVFGSSATFFAASTGTETSPFSHNLSFDIHRPFFASQNKTYSLAGSEGLSDVLILNGFLQASTSFDGFAFSGVNTATNIAGTFRIYGYRN